MERTTIKVAGESGMGLLSSGHIISRALKHLGFYMTVDREYPSLIKGGSSNVQIEFGIKQVRSLSTKVDIVVALDRHGLLEHISSIKRNGILIHGYERHNFIPELKKLAKKHGVRVFYLPARQIAKSLGGTSVMVNMVLLGFLWRVLGLDAKNLKQEVSRQFKSKPALLNIDLKCIDAGYKASDLNKISQLKLKKNKKVSKTILLDGTDSISLGAIHAGLRNYYMYPMSPASGILTYIAKTSHETGIMVKQAEDEITAVQMTIGSMHAGSRSMLATSGGGYDLMTESISLAGMTETPLVIIIGQRPGPATGLATWTCQSDLNLAIHSSHGDFPRAVIACSDQKSSFELIQHAFNIAETYQIPVIVLTEKEILEKYSTVEPFKQNTIPIKRGIVTKKSDLEKLTPKDRFAITKSGISKRWIPGTSKAYFYANGDEHNIDGKITEDAKSVSDMMEKRMRKETTLKNNLPDPIIHGVKKNADISFVGWGSSKTVMLDVIDELKEKSVKINYLHYDYVWPIKEKPAIKFFQNNKNIYLIENNFTGQFGKHIEAITGKKFKSKMLKYNGRSFHFDEVIAYIKKRIKSKR
ncbi:2-oxoacid:acceptor oxidoreductase subunit alpha [bacterium]|nr:2-oxoacid:acceptor oxidoreductase subunit alpha [bacterium]